MANMLTFTTPLMRQTVGFDRLNDLFESIMNEKNSSSFDNYPPYNIEKLGDDHYEITMAVAGFHMEELSIMLEDAELTITGTKSAIDEEQPRHFLHRGIATRNFKRTFRLADNIKVTGAGLDHGLLSITLERIIPEEKKPRSIPIGKGSASTIEGKTEK